jgi:hypothetical protein
MRSYKVKVRGHSGGCSLFTQICKLILHKNEKTIKVKLRSKKIVFLVIFRA